MPMNNHADGILRTILAEAELQGKEMWGMVDGRWQRCERIAPHKDGMVVYVVDTGKYARTSLLKPIEEDNHVQAAGCLPNRRSIRPN